jgi:DNA-directed RNA polymerase specialized sigma24 family protein
VTAEGFEQLAHAARAGDEHAFGLLWRRTNPGLIRYLRVMAPARADELAVAVWRSLVDDLPRSRGTETQWRTRAFATARRAALRAESRQAQRAPRLVPVAERRLADVVTELSLELLAELQPSEREVLVLRTSGGLSVAAVSEITKLSQPSVRTITRTALARASLLASDPVVRRRIDQGAPADQVEYGAAPLPGPTPSDAVLEDLLAGLPARPDAAPRTRLMAALVTALSAPPLPAELSGSGPAYAAFRRRFAARPKHARVQLPIRLGSRAAMAAGVASIALSGTVVAAYGGMLPNGLQDVAHHWLHAPPADGSDGRPPSRPGGVTPTGVGRVGGSAVVTSATPGGRSGAATGSRPAVATASVAAGTTPAARGTQPGASHEPPGATGTPHGATGTPPGSTKVPPSGSKTPPGSTKTPPGGSKTPPGSSKTPPGTSKTPPTGPTSPPPSHGRGR